MLYLAAAILLVWLAISLVGKQLTFHWANLYMVLGTLFLVSAMLCAMATLHQPYLTLDAGGRVLWGPGGWWWAKVHPKRGRTGAACTMRDGRLYEVRGDRERQLPFPRWLAHPGDWAELHDALGNGGQPGPPDWIRIGGTTLKGLPLASAPIRIGPNRKPSFWSLFIGSAVMIGSCAAAPSSPLVWEFYRLLAPLPGVLFGFGLMMLLFNPITVVDLGHGGVVAKSRMNRARAFPRPGYSHLEYSARLNAIHQVRTDGKRQLVAAAWQMEPKAWKHFTDLLQERRI